MEIKASVSLYKVMAVIETLITVNQLHSESESSVDNQNSSEWPPSSIDFSSPVTIKQTINASEYVLSVAVSTQTYIDAWAS